LSKIQYFVESLVSEQRRGGETEDPLNGLITTISAKLRETEGGREGERGRDEGNQRVSAVIAASIFKGAEKASMLMMLMGKVPPKSECAHIVM
jgi:hypothetical protein